MRFTYDFVKESLESEGYKLLSDSYENRSTKMDVQCPNLHVYKVSFFDWRRGRRCKECYFNSRRNDISDIRESFEREGYTLTTTKYENNLQLLKYICDKGHEGSIRWSCWIKGERCKKCYVESIKDTSIDEIEKSFMNEGYTLLTKEYKSCTEKLNFICPKGHKHSINWISWKQGQRCGKCKGNIEITSEEAKRHALTEGYTLLSDYIHSTYMMEWICPEGHHFNMRWNNFQQGQRCPICYKKGVEESSLKHLKGFQLYKKRVLTLTKESYRRYKGYINPLNIRRSRYYHLDHKYSITEGFRNCIPPYIIGSYCNLEIIPSRLNEQKGANCSITKEDLFNGWLTITTNQ
jgi:hypothetical protein